MMVTPDVDPIAQANAAQQEASNPYASAWVSASAGSGKTKVLTDRVLNLLLCNVAPERILCLTYTKTAAAEMANRMSRILRDWALMDEKRLRAHLIALRGQDFEPELIPLARKLFARLLDVKGGMKITTIHSFCESVLRRFPLEADLPPSFDIIDEKEARVLMSRAIKETLDDVHFAPAMRLISGYVNESGFSDLMSLLSNTRSALKHLLDTHDSLKTLTHNIYKTLGVPSHTTPAELIRLVCPPDEDFDAFCLRYLTKKGTMRERLKEKDIPIAKKILDILNKINTLKVAEATEAFLTLGFQVLFCYKELKARQGVLDYDDLISQTRQLLSSSDMAAWVLYKLDGGIDHILLDEAQDTSPDQWDIVRKLAEDFFSGESKSEVIRTMFVVGDKKQSIYSFQGADPHCFEKMHDYFKKRILDSENEFKDVPLNISFRSVPAVLDVVNYLLNNARAKNGILTDTEQAVHLPARRGEAGRVEVWDVCQSPDEKKEKTTEWELPLFKNKTQSPSAFLAKKIADRIHQMLTNGEKLESQNRPIEAGDIMILVRRRNSFIIDLVRALKDYRIPVAGVDRLVLTDHIAVMDLLSLGAFLLLPTDDLRLAEILKSPLCGLTEDELFKVAYGREGSLWDALRHKRPDVYDKLSALLAKSDTVPPFELYDEVLSSYGGRSAFLKRLGYEANDALDEFLNLALKYEQTHTPSLQGFLHWMSTGKIEIKRDLDQSNINAVRIMTVHGSKGLQAPIVILPDTRSKPKSNVRLVWINGLPVWIPKNEMTPACCVPFVNAMQNAEEQEYNRLMYVAITRAKDRLYLCGYDTAHKKSPKQDNWYDMITSSLPAGEKVFTCPQTKPLNTLIPRPFHPVAYHDLPAWFNVPAPQEPVPPKPLSPSKPQVDEPPAPSPLFQQEAMRRGTFIHKMLQLLPDIAPDKRLDMLHRLTPKEMDVPDTLLDIFQHPHLQNLFGADSMAEVPLIGKVDDFIVSGQVDRLVITSSAVLIIDFKTNKNPPQNEQDVPQAYRYQLNMYKRLLKSLFADKEIKSYLLWTENLKLMEIK